MWQKLFHILVPLIKIDTFHSKGSGCPNNQFINHEITDYVQLSINRTKSDVSHISLPK
jgi:hypothetical protein